MTWAEFQIRAYAYKRMQEKEDLRTREIAYNALIAPSADPKKIPKSKDKFWQIGNTNIVIDDDLVKMRIKEAQQKYQKNKK